MKNYRETFRDLKSGFFLYRTSDKVYQLLAHGQWFSPGTLASSTTKTGRHDIVVEGRGTRIVTLG
jgi:hypothetical protein